MTKCKHIVASGILLLLFIAVFHFAYVVVGVFVFLLLFSVHFAFFFFLQLFTAVLLYGTEHFVICLSYFLPIVQCLFVVF